MFVIVVAYILGDESYFFRVSVCSPLSCDPLTVCTHNITGELHETNVPLVRLANFDELSKFVAYKMSCVRDFPLHFKFFFFTFHFFVLAKLTTHHDRCIKHVSRHGKACCKVVMMPMIVRFINKLCTF